MITTELRLWTVDEYHRMIEAEILTTEDRVELVEGQIIQLNSDRTLKSRIYAQARIAEYWIIDVNVRQVYVLREPGEETYQQEIILDGNAKLSPLAFPEIEVEVSQMFL
ncbi:MAG: hypothetical protein CLLPBCKN_001831 [Chroococcidiopsis cubana SAG 39.79]|nr:Uma2 family endonuclease [Chroococcidiopsis cubana]MDZ4872443.1 hypothetical protein [Chroococcidiopsis cubana SAG 39.79]PSB65562.1 hypothetical protein C7B79_04905 [Chroococcidiopsis cubana CCALA 043]